MAEIRMTINNEAYAEPLETSLNDVNLLVTNLLRDAEGKGLTKGILVSRNSFTVIATGQQARLERLATFWEKTRGDLVLVFRSWQLH